MMKVNWCEQYPFFTVDKVEQQTSYITFETETADQILKITPYSATPSCGNVSTWIYNGVNKNIGSPLDFDRDLMFVDK